MPLKETPPSAPRRTVGARDAVKIDLLGAGANFAEVTEVLNVKTSQ